MPSARGCVPVSSAACEGSVQGAGAQASAWFVRNVGATVDLRWLLLPDVSLGNAGLSPPSVSTNELGAGLMLKARYLHESAPTAFAIGGPTQCSGLDIVQYDAEKLAGELGDQFELIEQAAEIHRTPVGKAQRFSYFRFTRKA